MNTVTWVLGTALPGAAALIGALKWLVRQELAPFKTRHEQLIDDISELKEVQEKQGEKLDRVYDLILRKVFK